MKQDRDRTDKSKLTIEDLATLLPKPVTALVELPSKGNFYNPELLRDGMVEVSPMSAREEKLIAGMRGNNVDEIIDILLRRCMKTQIDPEDLLVTDRFFLLLALRANSYGEEYMFELTCPHCEQKAKYTVKLPGDLTIQEALPEDKEPFHVTLPVSGLDIEFRLLRGKDQKAIKKAADDDTRKGYAGEGDPSYLVTLAKIIERVNGKTLDYLTSLALVGRLPAKDSATLKGAMAKKTPGILTSISKDCVACGKAIETEMPITAEFFRPDL